MTDERLAGPDDPRIEVIECTTAYRGFFRLERYRLRHRLYNGAMSPVLVRELFERGKAVAVLPYDPVRDAVILLEQFRIGAVHTPNAWLIEIVAGIVEEGETAEIVARRETREEAGCELLGLEHICSYYVSPGGTSESIELFCGRVDADGVGGIHGLEEEVEDIRVYSVSVDRAMEMVKEGRIDSAAPIIALQWLALNREALRSRWC